jgi:hypothetical protein
MLDNIRLNKMLLEYAQMLCTSLYWYGVEGVPYKPSHINHPCSVWARQTRGNFSYLTTLAICVEQERLFRGFNPHRSYNVVMWCADKRTAIPKNKRTGFVNCCTHHKHIKDVYLAYKLEMIYKWTQLDDAPSWGKRELPDFYLKHKEK